MSANKDMPPQQGHMMPPQQGYMMPPQYGQMTPMQQGQMMPMQQGQMMPMQQGQMMPMQQGQMMPMQQGQMMPMQQGQVMMMQPGYVPQPQYVMMPFPGSIPGVPEGLEYLTAVDQLICKQEVELFEAMSGIECKNKYRIFNSVNQQVYYAHEESDDCHRIMCGPQRGFVLHITDNQGQEVLNIVREFRCCGGCCWCADGCSKYPMFINDKFGKRLGLVRQMDSCCQRRFGIFDDNEQFLYEIWAPCCPCQNVCKTEDINFPVCSSKDKGQVANIRKIWGGIVREAYTKADTFGVSFPLDLDVKHKALMLATIFLIDFTLFEQQNNNKNNHH